MKIARRITAASLFLTLFATPVAAVVSPSSSYMGTLSGVNVNAREILVNTSVPGLLGPEEKTVPFKIDGSTTVTICYRKVDFCERALSGNAGLKRIEDFEQAYAKAGVSDRKAVVVVADPGNAGRTVHVQVAY